MSEIDNLREKFDELDAKIVELLAERLELSENVAKSKISSKTPVYNMEREKQVILNAALKSRAYRSEITSILKNILRISREKQYELTFKADNDWQLKKDIANAQKVSLLSANVVFCGQSGSYSETAAKTMFPHSALKGVESFETACRLAAEGKADIAVVPLENTTAGTVNEVYDYLPKYGLYIVKSLSSGIEHSLLGVKGATLQDIKRVVSHPQALIQCDKLIKKMNWETITSENTAFAAEMAAEENDKTLAAIASCQTKDTYGLDIILENINDESCNQTRFVALSRKMYISPDAGRVSIAFNLPHESGSLASILSIFADLELNLVKIQSRPIPHKPWEYLFYLDFTSCTNNDNALRALYQLENELPYLAFLGWYEEEK